MTVGGAPVDLDDALAVVDFGGDAIDAGLDARLAEALGHEEATRLVARLQDLHRAMPAGTGRGPARVGLFARLTGRDVVDQAEAEAMRSRLGVLLLEAGTAADALAARIGGQDAVLAEGDAATSRLDARIRDARAWLAAHPQRGGREARDRLERRLAQLDTVHAMQAMGLRQLRLLREQHVDLLARCRRIRDVLGSAWRQQALASAGRHGAEQARAAADAQSAIESELAAMAVHSARMRPPHDDRGPPR